jgi:hypothetical protein
VDDPFRTAGDLHDPPFVFFGASVDGLDVERAFVLDENVLGMVMLMRL